MRHIFSGQSVRTGSSRKDPRINGTWKQYYERNLAGFFPVTSNEVPILFRRKTAESHRKNLERFRSEYCFHVPSISGAFLSDTVTCPHLSGRFRLFSEAGIIDLVWHHNQ
jgi:hypothetical protein